VDVVLRYQLRTDYFRDVEDVELQVLHHLYLKMDYFQDVELQVYFLQQAHLHLD
jgi:hypothetical protein